MNEATSDFIGVYTSMAPAEDCDSTAPLRVAVSPAGIAGWLARNSGFTATAPRGVTVGGLPGMVIDLRMAVSWTKTCPYSNGEPLIPLLSGRPPSALEHNLVRGQQCPSGCSRSTRRSARTRPSRPAEHVDVDRLSRVRGQAVGLSDVTRRVTCGRA